MGFIFFIMIFEKKSTFWHSRISCHSEAQFCHSDERKRRRISNYVILKHNSVILMSVSEEESQIMSFWSTKCWRISVSSFWNSPELKNLVFWDPSLRSGWQMLVRMTELFTLSRGRGWNCENEREQTISGEGRTGDPSLRSGWQTFVQFHLSL